MNKGKSSKTLQSAIGLVGSAVTILGGLIPVYQHFQTSESFAVVFHVESVTVPQLSRENQVKPRPSISPPAPAPDFARMSKTLFVLTVRNDGSATRHRISIQVHQVHEFAGVGVQAMPRMPETE